MNCLLVSATSLEISPFIQHCRNSYKLDYIDLHLDFLITGVGMLNTTYALMKHLQLKRPTVVIDAGIAGTFSNKSEFLERTSLPQVNSISVNQITTSKKKAELYQTKYKAHIENMEGAAVHYVCLREKIPFVQIRSISNVVGDRNKRNWKLKEAVNNLNTELIRLVESL